MTAAAEWWRCPNPACNASNHPTITVCGLCHHPKPGVQVDGPFGKVTVTDDDASAMKIRAENRAERERDELQAALDAKDEEAKRVRAIHLRRHTELSVALGMDPGYSAEATLDEAIKRIAALDEAMRREEREWQTLYETLKPFVGDKV